MWIKAVGDNRLLKDITICDMADDKNRTRKVFDAIGEACDKFDLSRPIWLDKNIEEFKKIDKTRFYQDNFIDGIDFDYLEVCVIEEDY